jgi:hypothetical protein
MDRGSSVQGGWDELLADAIEAEREARRLAAEQPDGSPEQAAGAATATRLREFIRDVRLAARRGRTNTPAYRSVFEQIVPPIRARIGR